MFEYKVHFFPTQQRLNRRRFAKGKHHRHKIYLCFVYVRSLNNKGGWKCINLNDIVIIFGKMRYLVTRLKEEEVN